MGRRRDNNGDKLGDTVAAVDNADAFKCIYNQKAENGRGQYLSHIMNEGRSRLIVGEKNEGEITHYYRGENHNGDGDYFFFCAHFSSPTFPSRCFFDRVSTAKIPIMEGIMKLSAPKISRLITETPRPKRALR